MKDYVICSSTVTNKKYDYDNWFLEEVLQYVRDASCLEDAIFNFNRIVKTYERIKTAWEVFKQWLSKI